MKSKVCTFFALGLIFLPACTTTTESLLASRGHEGRVFTYPADYDRVFNAAVEAARSRRLKMIRRDRKEGLLLASDTIRWLNGGGRIALFLPDWDLPKPRSKSFPNLMFSFRGLPFIGPPGNAPPLSTRAFANKCRLSELLSKLLSKLLIDSETCSDIIAVRLNLSVL